MKKFIEGPMQPGDSMEIGGVIVTVPGGKQVLPQEAVRWLLTRIGSWTPARWDQHLRHEYGDEIADRVIVWLSEQGVFE